MEKDLFEVTENAWAIVLGLPLHRRPAGEPPNDGATIDVEGRVDVFGAWNGSLVLACSKAMAERAAAIMFELPAADVTESHCRDALGELTNIIGGNLKALLPDDADLSAPVVKRTTSPQSRRSDGHVIRIDLECEGAPVQVEIHER